VSQTLLVVLKRPGNRKADGTPYLLLKALVPVGERGQSVGMDIVEQFVDPGLDAKLTAIPGTYAYQSENRPMNGKLEQVITDVHLMQEGFPA
jgi:hypothetical protein